MSELIFTDQNFEEEVLKSSQPVVIDLWAPWCGPCQMISPIIEEIAREFEGKIKVGKLNIDENPNTPKRYGIMSIPTVIIFKDGKVIDQIVGVRPDTKEVLENKIRSLIQ